MMVSVIIVTRNTCALTGAAIRSVEESRGDFAREIIVVDNGSSDDTKSVLPREHPSIRYVRSEVNLGFARANNLGARDAQGGFFLLLNSDARLQPDSLPLALKWMNGHADCGIAGAQLLNRDGSKQNSIANFPTLGTELLNKSLMRRLFPGRFPGKEQQFAEPLEVESVIGAFMLIRAAAWRAVGGLDERYFFFLEETDFCLQARRRGWKTFHLPQVKVFHEQGGSARKDPAPARIEYWRSRYAYFAKNHSPTAGAVLRVGLRMRLLVNGLSAGLLHVLTLGKSPKWGERSNTNAALRRWHRNGCPADMGLPR